MIRGCGVCLILLSAAMYLAGEKSTDLRQDRTVQDLLSALENIETAIRWKKQALPDTISAQTNRRYAGSYFRQVSELLQSDTTLQTAWERTFCLIEPEELSKILCAISFMGDSTFLIGQLSFAAEEIKSYQSQKRAGQATRRKLKVTAALSIAGVIIILLL